MMQRIILYCAITSTVCLHGMEKIENFPLKMTTFNEKLKKQIEDKNTILCVGLDTEWAKIPNVLTQNIDPLKDKDMAGKAIFNFLKTIIDNTAPHTCCYKLNVGFYLDYGNLIQDVINYIKNEQSTIPIIVDCKTGDIENTMKNYINYYFNTLKADAITINPYFGEDSIAPFQDDASKTGIVVIKSSNPSADEIQYLGIKTTENNLIPLWKLLLIKLCRNSNTNNNLMAVLSGNLKPIEYVEARNIVGENFNFLVPGVGAQGANPANFLPFLKNQKTNNGIIIVADHTILYPCEQNDKNWIDKLVNAAVNLKNQLNHERTKNIQLEITYNTPFKER